MGKECACAHCTYEEAAVCSDTDVASGGTLVLSVDVFDATVSAYKLLPLLLKLIRKTRSDLVEE